MADRDDEDDQFGIFDFGDDSIVADAVSPLADAIRCKRFAMNSRILAIF